MSACEMQSKLKFGVTTVTGDVKIKCFYSELGDGLIVISHKMKITCQACFLLQSSGYWVKNFKQSVRSQLTVVQQQLLMV